MPLDAWITLATLAAALGLLASDRLAPSLVVFGADVFLLLTGVIDAPAALEGFSNPAPFTVAALFVMARAVEKTGAIQPVISSALGTGRSARRSLARLLLPVATSSAFLNNTPIVAMTTAQVARWADSRGRPASDFLMPLSFAAILGGATTLIGTSTTLLVSGLMEAHGMAPMGMFEITRLGLPVALVGLAYLVLFSHDMLPRRAAAFREMEEKTRDFIVQMEVRPGGSLDGVTVGTGGLRHLERVFLTEVQRAGGDVVAPARPETRLHGGDVLVFAGAADHVVDLQAHAGLMSSEREHVTFFQDAGHTYFEVVVGAGSPLAGRTLAEVDFRKRFGAAVLAIHRAGAPVRAKLGTVELRPGDTLLVLSDADFGDRWRDRSDFILISRRGEVAPSTSRQGVLVLAALIAVVGTAAAGVLPILHGSLAAALLLLVSGVLTPGEARRAVDLNVVGLMAAAFGLAAAVEQSGLAAAIVGTMVSVAGGLGPWAVLLGLILVTLLLTELVTNSAAAVLVFPVAMAAAAAEGIDPRPVALAVAVAASASFLTPIGYQTNTMVYGPGGYRFGDYVRLGAPLTLLVVVVLMALHPW
ncbi:MAG: SLC13 family permease [Gemmatimonadota bacterium]|jgi:di/tricarboxylate transporter